MTNKLKILIISNTPWDDNNSFGNSFSNIFGGNYYEIANIYCQPGLPNTKVCTKFFQITEKNLIKNLFLNKCKTGNEIFQQQVSNHSASCYSSLEQSFLNKLKIIRWQIIFWIRDFIWFIGRWKSKELNAFINNFDPDLIFLPIYNSSYINNIGMHVSKVANVKMVGYISDDNYTLKQFSLSPLFWIDRIIKRKYVKKSIEKCEFIYTITKEQQKEYSKIFGNKCKILYKGGNFNENTQTKKSINNPIKLIYTGNLGIGRWKTLSLIANSLEQINKEGIKAQLFIYSQTVLSHKAKKRLNIPNCSFTMGSIPFSQIKKIQQDSDILIHVESFNYSERYNARLSFSTKIVDYFEAGRCILAIGWENTGAIKYLKENDAAIVITELDRIHQTLFKLLNNENTILKYSNKSFECGRLNHQISIIREDLCRDFQMLIK